MMIFSPDSLRTQVEAATGGHITVLYDDKGFPSYMRVIPKFRYEDLGFEGDPLGTGVATAFLVNGQEKSEIFIGQYLASVVDNRAVALPGRDPQASINYDTALTRCTAKGAGWHLVTAHEWAALALWCMANEFQPRGNTDWGRHHTLTHEVALRPDGLTTGDTNGNGRTVTGGGPASWRHDGSITGIADLVGNVWEWQHLLKFVDGRIVTTPDNNYAAAEADWVAQDHYVSNEGGTPTLQNSAATVVDAGISVDWGSLAKDAGYTESTLIQRLLLSPAGVVPEGRFSINTSGERFPYRGGSRNFAGAAGLAALYAIASRSFSFTNIGFRPAFVA